MQSLDITDRETQIIEEMAHKVVHYGNNGVYS